MITGAYCRWAVLLALAQMLILSIIESAVFTIVLHFAYSAFDNFSDRITLLFLLVYYSLYIVAQIFSFFLVWDAARRKNTAQIIAASLFNGCILLYSGVAIRQLVDIVEYKFDDGDGLAHGCGVGKGIGTDYICENCVGAFGCGCCDYGLFVAVGAYVAYKVYQEIGWSIFSSSWSIVREKTYAPAFPFFMMLLKIKFSLTLGLSFNPEQRSTLTHLRPHLLQTLSVHVKLLHGQLVSRLLLLRRSIIILEQVLREKRRLGL
ncbi:hypothetical protein BC829DRAFT_258075 [Chytridium lagenaria]|nr:hypothetical protein BC829DRAFT_258075 [Chytridium lagenaria]